MFKIILYIAAVLVVVIAGASIYHLYSVSAQNKKQMSQFEQKKEYQADLGKVLVVYYSLTGHTKYIANKIAEQAKADLYEIKTKEVYTSPSVYLESKKKLKEKKYPELQGLMPSVEAYDTVFVGGPVWWYTMAPALYTYLKKTDFKGKRVVPFSTQGSNFGSFFKDFEAHARHAEILKGESFNNMSEEYDAQVKNKIISWLNTLSR